MTKITSWRTEQGGLDVGTSVAVKAVALARRSFAVGSRSGTLGAPGGRDTRARGGTTPLVSSSCCRAAIAADYTP